MKTRLSVFLLLPIFASTMICIGTALSGEPPANSDLALEDSFDRAELGKGWSVQTGEWKIVDGVLRAREIPEDQHAAAARRLLPSGNAVYELRFRFVGEGKSFHFGFDPARGELEKKGHLFSAIVTPDGWKVMKHVDKAKPKEDPNEVLGEQKRAFRPGEWASLRITTWGPYVTASIDGKEAMKVSHPTFIAKKPTLVFRCVGDGVEVDDIKVWTEKK